MAMFMHHYQEHTRKTAIYPEAGTGTKMALAYVALGLAGEAGEIANKVKKLIRDKDTEELRDAIAKEAGDAMWYLFRTLDELGVSAADIALNNIAKLQDRATRGVLQGSGDNR